MKDPNHKWPDEWAHQFGAWELTHPKPVQGEHEVLAEVSVVKFEDRRQPCLLLGKNGVLRPLAYFKSEETALEFVELFGRLTK